jgi:hypothetical protein
MSRLILGLLLLVAQSSGVDRQQRLTELKDFSTKLTAIILDGKAQDLATLLSYEVVISREVALPAAAVRKDLGSRGELYCRIFDSRCARNPKFLSARQLLMNQGTNLQTDIRFYTPDSDRQEDLDFAYITYSLRRSAPESGWPAGIFVGLERIGNKWTISALFPSSY